MATAVNTQHSLSTMSCWILTWTSKIENISGICTNFRGQSTLLQRWRLRSKETCSCITATLGMQELLNRSVSTSVKEYSSGKWTSLKLRKLKETQLGTKMDLIWKVIQTALLPLAVLITLAVTNRPRITFSTRTKQMIGINRVIWVNIRHLSLSPHFKKRLNFKKTSWQLWRRKKPSGCKMSSRRWKLTGKCRLYNVHVLSKSTSIQEVKEICLTIWESVRRLSLTSDANCMQYRHFRELHTCISIAFKLMVVCTSFRMETSSSENKYYLKERPLLRIYCWEVKG